MNKNTIEMFGEEISYLKDQIEDLKNEINRIQLGKNQFQNLALKNEKEIKNLKYDLKKVVLELMIENPEDKYPNTYADLEEIIEKYSLQEID